MVYNAASDGHYYNMLVAGFTSALEQFPEAETVVLEIGSTEFDIDLLEASLEQREYDVNQTGEVLSGSMSSTSKLKALIKENLPLVNVAKSQFENIELDFSGAFGFGDETNDTEETSLDLEEYYEAVHATAELMADAFGGNIIVMYHPTVELNEDGTLQWAEEETYEVFRQALEDEGIIFLDLQNAFQEAYDTDSVLPYGFDNTSPGSGHLNKYGHAIAAQALYEVLKEVQ